jgi:hypothetical protein
MINNKDIEDRISVLEAGITSNTFEFCRCAVEGGLLLKRNKKTGEIIEIDPDTDIPINSYIIIFPEIEVYGLYKEIDKYDALNPFDKWFLLKAFNAKDEVSLMKAINKYWKQRMKEDAERRADIEIRLASKKQIADKVNESIPIKSNVVIPIDKPAPKEIKHTPEWEHDYRPNW